MHQLAVVGGGRNANGMPGVFGPADGRGQFSIILLSLSACTCAYSYDGPKSISKTKQISLIDACPAIYWPRVPNNFGFND